MSADAGMMRIFREQLASDKFYNLLACQNSLVARRRVCGGQIGSVNNYRAQAAGAEESPHEQTVQETPRS